MHIFGQDTFESKIKYFEAKQKALTGMYDELKKAEADFELWLRETEKFKEFEAKQKLAQKEAEVYKAEMKAAFGIADGEKADILSLLKAMKKVQSLA